MRTLLLFSAFAVIGSLSAQKTPQEAYIDKYAPVAVKEMHRTGIPASITLAQGILESRSGQSELAVKGNNHFGIKCHSDWKGKRMYHDDDEKGECFRVYRSAEDSFRDHSDFLRYRDRYAFLFDYAVTDYRSWAKGLRKAGYATDIDYPSKLVRIIEDYSLYRYDSQITGDELPDSPSVVQKTETVIPKASEVYEFSLEKPVYRKNGVTFVYAAEGDDYASIATANSLFVSEILRFNDEKENRMLQAGEVVYVTPKKRYAAKGMEKYIVERDGESLHDICHRFAVRQKSIMKLNSFPGDGDVILKEGDTVKLRKR